MTGRVDALKNAPLLDGVSRGELEQLAALVKPVALKPSQTFAIRGQPNPGLVLVDSGSLEVLLDSTPICSLSPGSVFAEEALVSEAPAPATLRAAVASNIGVLERRAVEQQIDLMPKVWEALERAWRLRVLAARLYAIDLYRELPVAARLALVEAFEEADVPAGATLVERGKVLSEFVVVREGQLELEFPEDHEPSRVPLRRGEYVGDDVLLREYPQSAKVSAPYGARVMKLSRAALERALSPFAGAVDQLRRALARREESILL